MISSANAQCYDIFFDEDDLVVILGFRFSHVWNTGPRSTNLQNAIAYSGISTHPEIAWYVVKDLRWILTL
jgi:hypothetical protein